MIRDNLDNLPQFTTPPGYAIRWYERGDEKAWRDIQAASDRYNTITQDLYRTEFGYNDEQLHGRQCYVVDDKGIAVGTATAWYDDSYKELSYGRIHWVAILPTKQGLGLAKPLMTTVCERPKSLGHRRAYLTTSTARIPAINLYLKFGFAPDVISQKDVEIWQGIQNQLKYSLRLTA
jgi:GNAT superfamily N-acetyltransferase